MHGDIKVWNLYVVNAGDLDLAELAVGDFGAAQLGEKTVRGYEVENCWGLVVVSEPRDGEKVISVVLAVTGIGADSATLVCLSFLALRR